MVVWSMPVSMELSVLMPLRRARARRVDLVLSVTPLMERSVQVCANDIHDPYHQFLASDINECESESSCAQVCTNTEGSYECSCNRGYVVSDSDPTECVGKCVAIELVVLSTCFSLSLSDFNECRTLVEHCEQICTNTDGSFTCSCQTGFRSDGPFCSRENNFIICP